MIFETLNGYILQYFYYLFIGLLVVNMVVGFRGKDFSKRIPLILNALLFFLVYVVTVLTKMKNLPSWLPVLFFLMLFGTSYTMFRQRFFPYRFKCAKCGKNLTWQNILLEEGYICNGCKSSEVEEVLDTPAEAEAEE